MEKKPYGSEVCHNDGIFYNNSIENLRYDTHISNESDKIRHGTLKLGEKHHRTGLKNSDVADIKRKIRDGVKNVEIAYQYNISQGNVSDIKIGRTWKHITIEENTNE